jgi:hypothetical protein
MIESRRTRDQRREQEFADRALRELFAGQPRPELPPFFASRCARRAEITLSCRPLSAAERALLRGYWAVTAIVGTAMLVRIDWRAQLVPIVSVGATLSIGLTLLPLLLFAQVRGGLCALMRRVAG